MSILTRQSIGYTYNFLWLVRFGNINNISEAKEAEGHDVQSSSSSYMGSYFRSATEKKEKQEVL